MTERSEFVRLARWLTSWRGIRTVLFVLLWPVTLVALFYAVENWRGGRAWKNYRLEAEQRGEKLDMAAFFPQAPPDPENFAAIPEVRAWFEKHGEKPQPQDAYSRATSMVEQNRSMNKRPRQLTDLVSWEQAFAAVEAGKQEASFPVGPLDREARAKAAVGVLQALDPNAQLIEALRAASSRPRSVYPVNYHVENPWAILLPHLASIRNVAQRVQLRACAELALDRTDAALADVRLILALSDSLREETILISQLVRMSLAQIAIQPVWEGLMDHRWTPAQLTELQAEFGRRNVMASRKTFGTELACGLGSLAQMKAGSFDIAGDLEPGVNTLSRWMPSGWYDFEKVNYARLFSQSFKSGWDQEAKRVTPSVIDQNQRVVQQELQLSPLRKVTRHRLAASLLIPAVWKVVFRGAVAQTLLDQTAVACALERYRLETGTYPDQLTELTPKYMPSLPHDLVTGKPLSYAPQGNNAYVLYSVGWNEKDDGGKPDKASPDDKSPDWVWAINPVVTPATAGL